MRLKIIVLFVLVLTLNQTANADWVKGYFSPEAGIDSLERIAILTNPVDSANMGFKIEPAGDQNGDGIDDLICIRNQIGTTINWYGYLFYGGLSPDSLFDKEFPRFTSWFSNIGDINNDGIDDFSGMALPNLLFETYLGGLNLSDSSEFTIEDVISPSTRAGDLNDDGILDLPVSVHVDGGYIQIFRIDSLRDTIPEFIIPDTARYFGINLGVSDFNGDNYDDLAVAAYFRDTNFVKFYWGGPSFDTIPDFIIETTAHQFGREIVEVDDFNADGYKDFIITGGAEIRHGLYYGGPFVDTIMDIPLNRISDGDYFGSPNCDDAGDVNNDGYTDIIVGYSNQTISSHVVYIYLGGPNADSLADVIIEDTDIPFNNNDMGSEVRGIGDFNGDNIDDFAIYSRRGWEGEVFVFAGWNGVATDVKYGYNPNLPDNFYLSQNYPNPFNPSTTIEFQLPQKTQASLSIYNTIGQKIRTLINKELPAGSYAIEWDGTNGSGNDVATGVYFYKLETEDLTLSKKMVLLR